MANQQKIQINRFTGLNTLDTPDMIDDTESPHMLNMYISQNGQMITRFGYELKTTIAGTGGLRGALPYYRTYGTNSGDYLMLFHNTGVAWYVTNSSFTAVSIASFGTDNGIVRGTVFNNLAIFGNGLAANTIKKWDGTASTLADLGGTPPDGDIFGTFGKRLFIAGVDTAPSTLYYSDLDDPEAGTSTNFQLVNVGDGQVITMLFDNNDALQIFKEDSMYAMNYTYDATFNISTPILLNTINNLGGSMATNSASSVYKYTYFLSNRGFESYGSSEGKISANTSLPLSLKISPIIDRINFNARDYISGVFFGNQYVCIAPLGTATVGSHVFVYDENIKRRYGIDNWVVWDHIPATQFVRFRDANKRDQLYFISHTDPKLYKFNETFSDAGVGYTRSWTSKTWSIGENTSWLYIDIEGAMTNPCTIYVDIEIDGSSIVGDDSNGLSITTTNFMLDSSGVKIEDYYINKLYTAETITTPMYRFRKRVPFPLGVNVGSSMNFTIHNSADAQGWLVNNLEIVFEPRNQSPVDPYKN